MLYTVWSSIFNLKVSHFKGSNCLYSTVYFKKTHKERPKKHLSKGPTLPDLL